jgi:hypothetical protein
MITPGNYVLKAIDANLGESKDGNPYVCVNFEVTEGEHKGETLPWFGHFTEKTKHQTARALKLLGFAGDDITKLDTVRGQTSCYVEVEPGPDGSPRARVRFVGPRQVKELEPGKAAKFSAQLKGLFGDSKQDAPF